MTNSFSFWEICLLHITALTLADKPILLAVIQQNEQIAVLTCIQKLTTFKNTCRLEAQFCIPHKMLHRRLPQKKHGTGLLSQYIKLRRTILFPLACLRRDNVSVFYLRLCFIYLFIYICSLINQIVFSLNE